MSAPEPGTTTPRRPGTPPKPAVPPKPVQPAQAPPVKRLVLSRDPAEPRTDRHVHYGPAWLRPSIRMRITALYGGMFLIAGVLLLSTVYVLVRRRLMEGQTFTLELRAGTSLRDAWGSPVTPEQFQQLQEAQQDKQRDMVLDSLLHQSLIALLLLAIIAFGFGYLMSGRVLRPLGRITATAREVASSNLHRRIDLDGPDDELKELADTFDDMLDRLDRSFESQRKFVSNASHELRTPLAINRTLLEVHLGDPGVPMEMQQLGKTLLATNERSERLIEGLLLLARSDNELLERKPVDVGEVARRALDQVVAEAAEKQVDLRDKIVPAVAAGNGVLLERVALNLMQNAVRYNTPGGWVQVQTANDRGTVLLTVSNTGPVVPAYEIDNMFEPFRRLRTERTGSDKGVGLGLSIVRSVVRAHGGWIEAEPRSEGGIIMRIGLPAGA